MLQAEDIRLKLSAAERKRIGQELLTKVESARSGMTDLLRKLNGLNDLYEGKLPGKDFPWENCSNVNTPLLQWVVDTYQAHVHDVVMGVRPITLIQPVEPSDRQRAQAVEDLLDTVHQKLMRIGEAFDPVSLYALLFGTCVPKVAWREEFRKVRRQSTDEYGVTQTESGLALKFKGPRLEFVDLRNFVVYPLTADSVDAAQVIGDQYRLTPSQIRERIKRGLFDKVEAEDVLTRVGSEDQPEHDVGGPDDSRDDYEAISRTDAEEVWFWELIAPYDADGDGVDEDCVFTMEAQTGVIVRATEYPYWHGERWFVRVCPFPRPGRFFGRGLGEILEQSQRELNAFLNQWLDAHSLAMSKSFKVRDSANIDPDGIKIAPGQVVKVPELDDVTEFEINPLVPGVEVLQVLRDYAERASGINDVSLGRETEGDKTAREVAIVSSEGGIRFGRVIERFQQSVTAVSRQVLGLLYQFLDDADLAAMTMPNTPEQQIPEQPQVPFADVAQQIVGAGGGVPPTAFLGPQMIPQGPPVPPPPKLTRDDLISEWDFVPHGNTGTANKVQQREEALAMYDKLLTAQNPLVVMKPSRIRRVTEDLLNAFGRRDIDAYIGTEEEAEMMEQQMAMQHQAEQQVASVLQEMQQGGGPGGPGVGVGVMAGGGGPMGGGEGPPGEPGGGMPFAPE